MAPRKTAPKAPVKRPEKNPPGPAPVPIKRYVSTKVVLWHPFAKVRIPLGPPGVILEGPDSWLDSQIGVGLVKEM